MQLSDLTTQKLLDLTHTRAAHMFAQYDYPWQCLEHIKEFILTIAQSLPKDEFDEIAQGVFAARDCVVAQSASITGPCIIDHETEIRHCAFIRGSALVGRNCVVGNSTELKNVVLFDCVQVPHYNYVGDSILGYKAHMGAGSITSNVRADKALILIHAEGEAGRVETGLKKFGAILGDYAEIGCNAVLNPGTIIGRGSRVYPTANVRGVTPEGCIYKADGQTVKMKN
jgi:NDP-sugar pyrophosphorylase family protein